VAGNVFYIIIITLQFTVKLEGWFMFLCFYCHVTLTSKIGGKNSMLLSRGGEGVACVITVQNQVGSARGRKRRVVEFVFHSGSAFVRALRILFCLGCDIREWPLVHTVIEAPVWFTIWNSHVSMQLWSTVLHEKLIVLSASDVSRTLWAPGVRGKVTSVPAIFML
jgi:hypothetical protein